MINCGSAQFDAPYDDFRDYEPFCKLGVLLPYIGFKELLISKYINKTVSLKYAVDVTTGACTAYLYANGVIMDSFDGTMGVQRPITAVNQQEQVSAVINGILGTATQAAKTIGTAGTTAVAGATLAGASSVAEAAPQAAKFAGGQSQIGGGAINTILSGYSTLQAAIDSPISTRGAYSGVLGEFGNQYPYFIFAWLKTSKPANEIETIGLPSNAGGAVGSFGGFLQCAAFNLANGFSGTDTEAEEIYSIMRSGVYVS
jgi:adenosylcobinamide amidohydrolase